MRPKLPPTPPYSTAALITSLLHSLPTTLIAGLGGASTENEVLQWAAGDARPNARGLVRLRVSYEVVLLLVESGLSAAEVHAWWEDSMSLAGSAVDASPMDLLRGGGLKEGARTILTAARALVGSDTETLIWPVTNLCLVDIDGVILVHDTFGAPVRTSDFSALEYWQPPLAKSTSFHYSEAAITAIARWAAMPSTEVDWLTSWNRYAHLLAKQIGLPALPSFDLRSESEAYRGTPWKKLTVADFVLNLPANQRWRILWIDDVDARGAGKTLKSFRSPKLINSLVLEPRTNIGLTEEMSKRATEFLAGRDSPRDDLTTTRSVYLRTAADVATEILVSRTARDWTLDQLAVMAGVTVTTLERLADGGMLAEDLDAVVRTLEALGIHAVALPGIASQVKLEGVNLAEHLKRFGPQ